jgi:hypothetical protein
LEAFNYIKSKHPEEGEGGICNEDARGHLKSPKKDEGDNINRTEKRERGMKVILLRVT